MLKLVINFNKKLLITCIFLMLIFNCISVNPSAANLKPDLQIIDLDAPTEMTQEEEVEIIVKVQNKGDKNISAGEIIEVGIFLDKNPTVVSSNSTNKGLDIGNFTFVNLSWIPNLGDNKYHTLDVVVNYNDLIDEGDDYDNNIWSLLVFFSEIGTSLKVIDLDVIGTLKVNETVTVNTTVKNYGKSTKNKIIARLNSSEDGAVETAEKKAGLDRDETHVFTFEWTPSCFGSQKLFVDVGVGNDSHHIYEAIVRVGAVYLRWWDEDWHYRYFLMINGSGNYSETFNFTEYLNDLGVYSQIFEDDTLRIIRYSNNGEVIGIVDRFWYNESTFDASNGTLLWNVTNTAEEKYYCVYFDVEINSGLRVGLSENVGMLKSGNVQSIGKGLTEGWSAQIVEPIDGGFTFIDDPINITVSTDAMAKNVSAFIYMTENISHNFPQIDLSNTGGQISWINQTFYFDQEGNWTIEVNSSDDAGYYTMKTHEFFVGKPDLEVTDIVFTTDNPVTSPLIYINDTVNVSGVVISEEATVENVNVTLLIHHIADNITVVNETKTFTIIKGIDNYVSFEWVTNKTGKYNVTIFVDSENTTDELKEDNNELMEKVIVRDWPDLNVTGIVLPAGTIMEFDRVKFNVVIANDALWEAYHYEVKLFIEKNTMKYEDVKDSENFSIDANSTKTINLYWDSASPGSWLVGARITINESKKERKGANKFNNFRLAGPLNVSAIESNKPVIKNVTVAPENQKQGGRVVISAKVTDDSGLRSVKIQITDTDGDIYNATMIRTTDNFFKINFDNTTIFGKYTFVISAIDFSIKKNIGTYSGNFTIKKDSTKPEVSYFDISPKVQLANEDVTFTCIATDNIAINSVKAIISYPDGSSSEKNMILSDDDSKYIYTTSFDIPSKYSTKIEVRDKADNWATSQTKYFWITSDLKDTDNDGMLDDWEQKYNLNPKDPTDAALDKDGDGYSNLKEYEIGTNPAKDIFTENVAYRLSQYSWYLALSIVLFLVILFLAITGKRRRK